MARRHDGENDFDTDHQQEPAPAKGKRTPKVSAKKAATTQEILEAKQKRMQQLEKEMRTLKKSVQSEEGVQERSGEEDFESEEEALPSGFSHPIHPLGPSSYTNTPQPRMALKRVGAAAARMPSQPSRVSPNAYKAIPTPSRNVIVSDDDDDDNDEENAGNFVCDPVTPSPSTTSGSSGSLPLLLANQHGLNVVGNRRERSPSLLLATNESARSAPKKVKLTTTSETLELVPAHRDGAEVNPKKPKASDYIDIVQALILRAASEYEGFVCTKDAFPDTATRNKWTKWCWKNAGASAGENYTLTDSVKLLLRSRGSRIRGHALTTIRPLLISLLGFKRGADAKTVAANASLFAMLKENSAFHYKDPKELKGFAQGEIISVALNATWFEDKHSQGIVFESLFNPVPLETLALIFTIIDFCLDEWSTGSRVKAILWEKDIIDRHRGFRLDLEQWSKLNPPVVLNRCKKLYTRASGHAGVTEAKKVMQTLVGDVLDRAREEMEGRTGETDSEAEEEMRA